MGSSTYQGSIITISNNDDDKRSWSFAASHPLHALSLLYLFVLMAGFISLFDRHVEFFLPMNHLQSMMERPGDWFRRRGFSDEDGSLSIRERSALVLEVGEDDRGRQ